jgi:hypothetical protein
VSAGAAANAIGAEDLGAGDLGAGAARVRGAGCPSSVGTIESGPADAVRGAASLAGSVAI